MKNKLTIAFFFLSVVIPAQIFGPEGLNMPGAYDGWSNPPTVNAIAGIQKTGGTLLVNEDLGQSVYRTLIYVNSSGADLVGGTYEWLFTSGPSTNYYNNKWGGITVTMDALETYTHGGANNSVTLSNGNYYTVIWENDGYSNSRAIWMVTSASPISISSVGDNYSSAGVAVDVSITLSGSKSAEENIFVRYTTDGWSTWSFVQATGSGTSYSATIPSGSVTGTANNQYYVFTTTLATGDLSTSDGDAVDLVTIAFDNNSGSNYALPVELTTFTGTLVNNTVELNWETATEVNNAGFNVECKIDNGEWITKNFVPGYGTTNSPKSYSYTDTDLPVANEVSYRLKQIDNDGTFAYSKVVTIELGDVTGVNDEAKQYKFELSQNYPNPFNPTTQISFTVPQTADAKLKVYDTLGNEIAELFNGKAEAGQTYNLNFDASNFSSGVYFYKLTSQNKLQIKKMLLLK